MAETFLDASYFCMLCYAVKSFQIWLKLQNMFASILRTKYKIKIKSDNYIQKYEAFRKVPWMYYNNWSFWVHWPNRFSHKNIQWIMKSSPVLLLDRFWILTMHFSVRTLYYASPFKENMGQTFFSSTGALKSSSLCLKCFRVSYPVSPKNWYTLVCAHWDKFLE